MEIFAEEERSNYYYHALLHGHFWCFTSTNALEYDQTTCNNQLENVYCFTLRPLRSSSATCLLSDSVTSEICLDFVDFLIWHRE
ncbi:hypothetical protein T4B_1483 [Trichinella pseudospiralis]|uniref:Uncharacterized protein n=1 Tax=Trichinella pseudospiralis TaxID=6337 RepID=A0A0V1IM53_TRIPS|nr:hypothetical protein T4B_1483 [Trichinella pseudospiralis]